VGTVLIVEDHCRSLTSQIRSFEACSACLLLRRGPAARLLPEVPAYMSMPLPLPAVISLRN
jgi:hypothetical protein